MIYDRVVGMSTGRIRRLPSYATPSRLLLAAVGIVGTVMTVDLVTGLMTGRISFATVSTMFWDGILRGAILGLAGVGLSMTYSILNFANFSHGDLITVGAFGGWSVTYLLAGFGAANVGTLLLLAPNGGVSPDGLGMNLYGAPGEIIAGAIAAALITIAVALIVDRLVYQPLRSESGVILLIASVGVALVLRYLIQFVYGPGKRGVTMTIPDIDLLPMAQAYGTTNPHNLTLLIITGLLIGAVHLLLQYTKLGTAMRAMADNKQLARVIGIPAERIVTWTWVIGGGLTGIAGYLIILERGAIVFNFGWGLLLLVFAAVILGGIGSIYGAIVGGLLIGLASTIPLIWIPADFGQAIAFLLMILTLLVRPTGLFGGVETA